MRKLAIVPGLFAALAAFTLMLSAPGDSAAEGTASSAEVPREIAGVDDGEAGRTSLLAAAVVAWTTLIVLVVLGFRRQRRLEGRLDTIEAALEGQERGKPRED